VWMTLIMQGIIGAESTIRVRGSRQS
jgi:hypothetical protein